VYSGEGRELTQLERAFLEPVNATHRQYEALRAYFVDKVPSKDVAARFGYTPGSFRVLCHEFRADPHRAFFLPERARAARAEAPPVTKSARLREKVIAARKQNLSVYDIAAVLAEAGEPLSPPAVWAILSAEGFAKLPRRADEERPARLGPVLARPTCGQQSNTDQQISFRNRWSSSTSSRIASGSWSRCHQHSRRPAAWPSPCGAAARAALIA